MSSAALPVEPPRETAPKKRTKRVGRTRKLIKRVEPKPDGRHLIYYKPMARGGQAPPAEPLPQSTADPLQADVAVDRQSRSRRTAV